MLRNYLTYNGKYLTNGSKVFVAPRVITFDGCPEGGTLTLAYNAGTRYIGNLGSTGPWTQVKVDLGYGTDWIYGSPTSGAATLVTVWYATLTKNSPISAGTRYVGIKFICEETSYSFTIAQLAND